MRRLSNVSEYHYEKEPYEVFMSYLEGMTGVQHHDLGESSLAGVNVKAISIGDLSKPLLLIDGGIHGNHEWRTTYWARRFVEIIRDESEPFYNDIIKKIKNEYCLMVIPILNPNGYINTIRQNANGYDLNRNFDHNFENWQPVAEYEKPKAPHAFSEPESRMIRDLFTQYNPIGYVNCHTQGATWDNSREETVIMTGSNEYNPLFVDLGKSVSTTTHVRYDHTHQNRPMTASWGSRQVSRNGRNTVAFVLETSADYNDVDQAKFGINALFSFCEHAIKWYEEHEFIVE